MNAGTPPHQGRDELFQLVADSLPLLVWISGSDKRCTYFNKPWLDFTGRPLESEIGDGWADGVHAADLQHCVDTYVRAFDRREPFMMEYRLRRHDGEYRWVLDNAAPLFDPDGSFAGYIGACFDVTEFRRAEAERNVANDRLRLAMESGKSVGWERDLKTNRDTWFGDLSTIFGIPSNIYVGPSEDFRRSVHPEDRGPVWKAVEDALENRSPYAAEFRILWSNGTVRWVAAKGQFHYSPGADPERMLAMVVDITERKDAEESLRRKERELENRDRLSFTSTVADCDDLAGRGDIDLLHSDGHTGHIVIRCDGRRHLRGALDIGGRLGSPRLQSTSEPSASRCLLAMPALPIIVACNTPFAAFRWRSTMLCANVRVWPERA